MRMLGQGGMGEVYLARDTKLGRKVALKLIRPTMLEAERAKELFMFEARATAKFNHQHIVTVFAVGEHEGRPYLALELLDGQTLRERMHERHAPVVKQSHGLHETARIGAAIADALTEAHAAGILHRDLKPSNVVIPSDGRLRVVDFGLATAIRTDNEPVGGSDDRSTAGTPAYMAPEQWRGQDCTAATDVWALGVILFELCAGRRPYQEHQQAYDLAQAVCGSEATPSVDEFAAIPPRMSELIARCLDKSQSERPSATEVRAALDDMLHHRSAARGADESPFRSLMPFGARDAGLFFGRDAEVAAFLERMRLQPVLPIVGPSGAGKSSFVQAGIIPRLHEQARWLVITLRPSPRPFHALSAALERARHSFSNRQSAEALAATEHASDSFSERQSAEALATTEHAHDSFSDEQSAEPLATPRDDDETTTTESADELRNAPRLLSMRLRALAERDGTRVLLFIDQLEELFTLVEDEETQRAFLEGICTAADDPSDLVRAAFTIRHDFLDRLASSPEARDALAGVTIVRRPSADALEQILSRPIEEVGFSYEDHELVDEMIASVAGEPACLPLLQFAAQMLWDGRDSERRLLLRSVYERIGGVEGALATHADGVLVGLSPSELLLAQQLLLRLVTPEHTRKTVLRALAVEGLDEGAEDVLKRLVGARLLTVAKAEAGEEVRLELAHESLIHNWSTLSHWLDASHEELSFLAELGQAAELWDRRGRRGEELWRGAPLVEAAAKLGAITSPVPQLVSSFIDVAQRGDTERLRRRRLSVAGAMLILAVMAAVFAYQRQEADFQRERAEEREALAEQRRGQGLLEGAREALNSGRMLEARAKLRGALEVSDSALSRTLWWQLSGEPLQWRMSLGAIAYGVAFAPDGRSVAVACQDRALYLLDVDTHQARILRGHDDQVFAVAFSPDGKRLASGSWSGEIRLWDVASGGEIRVLTGHTDKVDSVSFSPDGTVLASASWDKSVRLWDVGSGRERRVLSGHSDQVLSVSFAPGGKLLASGSKDKTVRLWDVVSGREERVLSGHSGFVHAVSFSADGAMLASGGADDSVRLWDVALGQEKSTLSGHTDEVRSLSFSADGALLASAGWDHTVRLWDLRSGKLRRVLAGHTAPVRGVSFSSDGARLASGSMDGSVRLWDVTLQREERVLAGHSAAINGLRFSPDGALLASASKDKTVRLWDVGSGREERVLEGHTGTVRSVHFSPDGTALASAGNDNSVRSWEVKTGRQQRTFLGHTGVIRGVRYSPDGTLLASASYDKTVRLWDVASGREERVLAGHAAEVLDVSFSPDGGRIASASFGHSVRLWDVATGREERVLSGHSDAILGVSFSPDGSQIATAAWDDSVRLWDAASGVEKLQINGVKGRAYGIDFHPDGHRVVVPVSDGVARIWDLRTRQLTELDGSGDEVNAAVFSPNGKLVATAGDDGVVRLWDPDDGRALWRAPLLMSRRAEGAAPLLSSHRGWRALGPSTPADGKPTRWRKAVEQHARFASVAGTMLCMRTNSGGLQMWDLPSDRMVLQKDEPRIEQVVAVVDACVVRTKAEANAGARALMWHRSGREQALEVDGNVTVLGSGGERVLLATNREILSFDIAGKRVAKVRAGVGVTALTRVGDDWLVVGYRDGNLELLPTDPKRDKPSRSFELTPSSAVLRILAGPLGTLVVGYANGVVALYDQSDGKRLEHARIHGPVTHLLIEGGKLYAVSDLGHHMIWDLQTFSGERCALLRQIWKRVPVLWESGQAVEREPPSTHACSRE
jgi:WD40 repeat protein/serine/threonine protein kinase